MTDDVVERATQFTQAFAEAGNVWRAEARALIIELVKEVERLRRSPDCATDTAASCGHGSV